MRFAKGFTCAAALGATMFVGGCAGAGGVGGAGGSGAGQRNQAAGAPSVGETAGNIAIQAGATEAMKKGGVGGSIGYGLQSHGSQLSRALFGKKKAAPKKQPTQQTAPVQ